MPYSRRASTDPEAVQLFVHLARIATAGSDVSSPARSEIRRDLGTLEQESKRRRPRRSVALALADVVLLGLEQELGLRSLVTLTEAREAMDRPHPDLRVLDGDVPDVG